MGHRRHDLELKARIWIATIQVQSAGDHSTSRAGGGNGGDQKSYHGKSGGRAQLARYPAVNGGCCLDRLNTNGCFYAYMITRVGLDYCW